MNKLIFPILFFFILSGTGLCENETELFDKGVELYKKGEHQQAIDTFSDLIALSPEKTEAYRIRGSAYMKLTQYDLAVKDFEKAPQENSPSLPRLSKRGCCGVLQVLASATLWRYLLPLLRALFVLGCK